MAPTWQDYFQPDEKLLWEGAPLPGVFGKVRIIFLAVFGMPFLIGGVAFLASGLETVFTAKKLNDVGLGLFLTAFSIPFAAIGLLLVVGQWVAAAQAHRKIRYALSNRCAYIAKAYWKRGLETYPIFRDSATGLEQGRRADTVWFHVWSERDSDNDRTTTRVSFENIADGETVYRLIRAVQTGTA